jgi:hypothetical protein
MLGKSKLFSFRMKTRGIRPRHLSLFSFSLAALCWPCSRAGLYKVYVPGLVIDEIKDAEVVKRAMMIGLANSFNSKYIMNSDAVLRLAKLYVYAGVVSYKRFEDAVVIAAASVKGIDAVVSMELKHISRVWTREKVNAVNAREGYKDILLLSPMEVIDDEA